MLVEKASDKTVKRANWESFAYSIHTVGICNIANHSHGDEDTNNHTYTIQQTDNGTIVCGCKAFKYGDGMACKHIVSLLENDAVRSAFTGECLNRDPRTDGGIPSEDTEESPQASESDTEDNSTDYEPDTSEEIQAMYAPYSVEAGIGLPPEDY